MLFVLVALSLSDYVCAAAFTSQGDCRFESRQHFRETVRSALSHSRSMDFISASTLLRCFPKESSVVVCDIVELLFIEKESSAEACNVLVSFIETAPTLSSATNSHSCAKGVAFCLRHRLSPLTIPLQWLNSSCISNVWACIYVASYFRLTNNMEESLKVLTFAESMHSGHADLYFSLGIHFTSSGLFQKSIAMYMRALEVNPNHSLSLQNLASIFEESGRFEESYHLRKRCHATGFNDCSAIALFSNSARKVGLHRSSDRLVTTSSRGA
jgi:tetratricopeptide (TPR) repeat protein